ncbi:MAG: flagellar filament capping protein FliD [Actinomycetota bacterium]
MSFQVSGLASGIDTSSLIDGLMFAERAPVRRLQSAVDRENDALDAWTDIQSRLSAIETSVAAIRDGQALEAATVSSSDEAVLQATVTGSPPTGTYALQVTALAAAEQVVSAAIGDGTELVGAGTAEISGGFTALGTTLNSHTLTDGTYNVTVVSVDADAQEAVVSFDGVTETVDTSGGSFTITGDSGGSVTVDVTGTLTTGTAGITIVEADASTTLAGLVSSINATGGPARAQLIDTGDGTGTPYRLVLTSGETGVDHAADIDLSALSLFSGGLTTLRAASDATVTLGGGGLSITRSTNTITDLIDGITLELAGTTSGSDVEISVGADIDSRVAAVTEVVDGISGVLGQLSTYSSYDVDAGTGGPLVGSFTARSVSSELTVAMSTIVDSSSIVLLSQIGITMQNDGTFAIDDATLRESLADDPAGVERLFVGDVTVHDDGVLDVVNATVEALLGEDGRIPTAQGTAEDTIAALETQIATQEVRLVAVEERYQRQFSALESLIGQLQSQSNYLTSILGQSA